MEKIGQKGLKCFKVIAKSQLPAGTKLMRNRWVYAFKERAHSGGVLEASARLTAKGYTQTEGKDYDQTHMPTMGLSSFYMQEAISLNLSSLGKEGKRFLDETWDITGAYYNSRPSHVQHMETPEGYGAEGTCWVLMTGFPGTKDAGHNFNEQFTDYLVNEVGLTQNPADGALFHCWRDGEFFSSSWFVDDAAAYSTSQKLMDEVYDKINEKYPLKRLDTINLIIGIYVLRDNVDGKQRTRFNQKVLIQEIAELANQTKTKHRSTPFPASWAPFSEADAVRDPKDRKELDLYPFRKLLGKAAYVARCTHWPCLHHVCLLQQYQTCYGWRHIEGLLHLIAYLFSNQDVMLTFMSGYDGAFELFAMTDASFATCPDTRVSHGGGGLFLFGCPIRAWAKKQRAVALSSMESEFMEAFEGAKELVHHFRLCTGHTLQIRTPLPVLEDNSAAIMLSMKPSLNSSRARHMEVRWHWLQQQHLKRLIRLQWVSTEWQVADLFTKNLCKPVFQRLAPILMGSCPINTGAVREALNKLAATIQHHTEQQPDNETMLESIHVVGNVNGCRGGRGRNGGRGDRGARGSKTPPGTGGYPDETWNIQDAYFEAPLTGTRYMGAPPLNDMGAVDAHMAPPLRRTLGPPPKCVRWDTPILKPAIRRSVAMSSLEAEMKDIEASEQVHNSSRSVVGSTEEEEKGATKTLEAFERVHMLGPGEPDLNNVLNSIALEAKHRSPPPSYDATQNRGRIENETASERLAAFNQILTIDPQMRDYPELASTTASELIASDREHAARQEIIMSRMQMRKAHEEQITLVAAREAEIVFMNQQADLAHEEKSPQTAAREALSAIMLRNAARMSEIEALEISIPAGEADIAEREAEIEALTQAFELEERRIAGLDQPSAPEIAPDVPDHNQAAALRYWDEKSNPGHWNPDTREWEAYLAGDTSDSPDGSDSEPASDSAQHEQHEHAPPQPNFQVHDIPAEAVRGSLHGSGRVSWGPLADAEDLVTQLRRRLEFAEYAEEWEQLQPGLLSNAEAAMQAALLHRRMEWEAHEEEEGQYFQALPYNGPRSATYDPVRHQAYQDLARIDPLHGRPYWPAGFDFEVKLDWPEGQLPDALRATDVAGIHGLTGALDRRRSVTVPAWANWGNVPRTIGVCLAPVQIRHNPYWQLTDMADIMQLARINIRKFGLLSKNLLVAVLGPTGRGKRFHHLECHMLFRNRSKALGIPGGVKSPRNHCYQLGTYVCRVEVARLFEYTVCGHCSQLFDPKQQAASFGRGGGWGRH